MAQALEWSVAEHAELPLLIAGHRMGCTPGLCVWLQCTTVLLAVSMSARCSRLMAQVRKQAELLPSAAPLLLNVRHSKGPVPATGT